MRMGSLTGFFTRVHSIEELSSSRERVTAVPLGIPVTRLSDPFDQKKATNKDTDQ